MSVNRNLIANFIGQGWSALMGLAFIPLYIKYLGIEAYGLIGVFALLQAGLTLLDMGMSSTLSREMARFMGGVHVAQSIRDLLRSIEVIALGIASLIAIVIWGASDWLATEWLQAEKLPMSVIASALRVMGVVTALRFMEGIYRSSIVGLQRQVLYNAINSAMATLRWLGAVGILAWVTPTVEAFFIWQGLISLLTLLIFARETYIILPKTDSAAQFSLPVLKSVGRFAGGILGITFLGLLLTQVDKILLSRLLNLIDYGYYTLAAVVSGGLYMMAGPIIQAYFPRLCALHASGDETHLIETYHRSAQLVTVAVGSVSVIIINYSETILNLWTHDAILAARSAMLLSILCLGNLFNCLMWIPNQTQIAYGWVSLALRVNIISVLFFVPTILWVTPRFGAEGAAWTWVGLNIGYVLLGIHFMHKKILIAEKWRWYFEDIMRPLMAAVSVAVLSVWFLPKHMTVLSQLVYLIVISGITLLTAALAARDMRLPLYKYVKKKFYLTKEVINMDKKNNHSTAYSKETKALTRHLDLGCGSNPRNPFNSNEIFGLDIVKRENLQEDSITFTIANLVFQNIPFPDNHFDSVSAYDFLEHIPRLIYLEGRTDLAFVRLMSEIHRVLKPCGQFYSTTPCYPMESAFVDPTHVNFISKNSHKYFTVPHLWARMYGYTGTFEVIRVKKVNFDAEVNKKNMLKSFIRYLLILIHPNAKQHIVWHFRATK